jgi:hypothetical protein
VADAAGARRAVRAAARHRSARPARRGAGVARPRAVGGDPPSTALPAARRLSGAPRSSTRWRRRWAARARPASR